MADFTFDGHEVTTDLMASVAQLLDTNGIPNVAWGSFALTVYGVPLVISVSSVPLQSISSIHDTN